MIAPSSLPFLTPGLLRQAGTLRAELQRAASEMTSGRVADVGAVQRGDFAMLAGIDRALSTIDGYTTTLNELAQTGDAMQRALDAIGEAATSISGPLLAMATVASEHQLSDLTAGGAKAMQQVVGILNSNLSGRSLFGGTASDRAPLPPADDLIDALATAITGATTLDDIRSAVHDWFTQPGGFATHYAGGPPRAAVPSAPGESVGLDVTAADDGLRPTLEGLAILALADRGLFDAQAEVKRGLVIAAGETLLSAAEPRLAAASRIGIAQERVADARARNEAERAALEISRVTLTEADPYEAATRLKDLEARLDGFYLLTARLSRLNLAEYLR